MSYLDKYNLPLINKCRCGGQSEFRKTYYQIECSSCGAKSNKGSSFIHDKPNPRDFLVDLIESWNRGEYRDWQDDYHYSCAVEPLKCGKKVRLRKPEYYRQLLAESENGLEPFYYAQTSTTTYAYDRKIFSSWLPAGISKMDEWYGLRIRELGNSKARFNYTSPQLKLMILKNPHLHSVIKSNLIENLNNFSKDL